MRPDGAIRHVISRGEVIDRDDEGHPTRVGGMLQDVTESVDTAERLARSEAHLSEAQRIASIGSWAWEIDTGQIEWSVEFSRVLGLPEDAVQGLDVFFASVHPADGERIQLSVAACVEASAPIDVALPRRPPRRNDPGHPQPRRPGGQGWDGAGDRGTWGRCGT